MVEKEKKKKKPLNKKRFAGRILAGLLVFLMLFSTAASALQVFAAEGQTTIIIFDKVKATYDIGEVVKVTVGISSTDGSYLTSAYAGFGYNGATMKQLTETDTVDHFTVTSDTPQKWLYYDIEFEMIADGKMFFIAGAYDGDGVIVARRADGSKIELPRASVMFKVGTGIYTKTSDCNLETLVVKDQNGTEIKFNRDFNSNITEYYADVDAGTSQVSIEASTEVEQDEIIYPDGSIAPGDNALKVGVKAVDGTVKEYTLNIHRPEIIADVSDIRITDQDGNAINYSFDPETTEYEIEVGADVSSVDFNVVTGNDYTKAELPPLNEITAGYNLKNIRVYTDTDEKTYEFDIYRELSSLSLSSLVVEASDETSPALDKAFDPEILEYETSVTADVRSAKLIYTLGHAGDMIKEDSNEYELEAGDNVCTVTVTDGVNEKIYTVTIHKNEYEKVYIEEEEEEGPKIIIPKDFTYFNKLDLRAILIIGGIILAVVLGSVAYKTVKSRQEYAQTDEAKAEKYERERNKRLKKKAEQRKQEKKEQDRLF